MATIMTQLSVDDGRAAVAFYAAAFGATEDFRVGGTDDEPALVAQLSIDGAPFWVSDESPGHGHQSPRRAGGATTRTLLLVEDPDAVQRQALTAGAQEAQPVADEHAWRLGRVVDPFGHVWEIGRPLGDWPSL